MDRGQRTIIGELKVFRDSLLRYSVLRKRQIMRGDENLTSEEFKKRRI
jgi:hypothetical protein